VRETVLGKRDRIAALTAQIRRTRCYKPLTSHPICCRSRTALDSTFSITVSSVLRHIDRGSRRVKGVNWPATFRVGVKQCCWTPPPLFMHKSSFTVQFVNFTSSVVHSGMRYSHQNCLAAGTSPQDPDRHSEPSVLRGRHFGACSQKRKGRAGRKEMWLPLSNISCGPCFVVDLASRISTRKTSLFSEAVHA